MMLLRSSFFAVTFTSLVVLSACSSEAAVGEACNTTGSVDECVSGAICVANGATAPRCLTVCTDSAQCAVTEECNGVEGASVKACRAKATTTK